jgi:hypothetical protein
MRRGSLLRIKAQGPEVGGQRSEGGGQKSEVRGQKAQGSEVGS